MNKEKQDENGRRRRSGGRFLIRDQIAGLSLLIIAIIFAFLIARPTRVDAVEPISSYTYEDIDAVATVIYNEARGVKSDTEKACVAWTILNRVDAGYGSIIEVASSTGQFAYYPVKHIPDDIYTLAADVILRWTEEKNGEENVGRVLPSEYMWFFGDGERNYFRDSFKGNRYWDYSLDSPYKN